MNIAIIENEKVVNVVYGEAEAVSAIYPNSVPETELTGVAWIGAKFNGEKFEPRQPYPSWLWDEETFTYHPPTVKPEGAYVWVEEELQWEEVTSPFPSWIWNEETQNYEPPVSKPNQENSYDWDENSQKWILIEQ